MTFAILNQAPTGIDEVPPALQPIVYRALSKEAEHRYASGKEIREELQAARAVIFASGVTPGSESGRSGAATAGDLNGQQSMLQATLARKGYEGGEIQEGADHDRRDSRHSPPRKFGAVFRPSAHGDLAIVRSQRAESRCRAAI